MVTLQQIKDNLSDITSAQIDKCTHIWANGGEYYLVANSNGELDEEGYVIEYKVQHSKRYGFQCDCACGKRAFGNVRHASGVCWHIRASVAAWLLEKAEEQAIQEKLEKHQTVIMPAITEVSRVEAGLQTWSKPLDISSIEASMPAWIMNARPSRGMDKAPREI